MIIRKKYDFESSHIVRKASSDRCRKSIHGHSYKVEIEIEGSILTEGHMLIDFIDLKLIKKFVDIFDHCHMLGTHDMNEHDEFSRQILDNSERVVILPMNASAEAISLIILMACEYMMSEGSMIPNSANCKMKSVTVHETATGSATACPEDIDDMIGYMKGSRLIDIRYQLGDTELQSVIEYINNRHGKL